LAIIAPYKELCPRTEDGKESAGGAGTESMLRTAGHVCPGVWGTYFVRPYVVHTSCI